MTRLLWAHCRSSPKFKTHSCTMTTSAVPRRIAAAGRRIQLDQHTTGFIEARIYTTVEPDHPVAESRILPQWPTPSRLYQDLRIRIAPFAKRIVHFPKLNRGAVLHNE